MTRSRSFVQKNLITVRDKSSTWRLQFIFLFGGGEPILFRGKDLMQQCTQVSLSFYRSFCTYAIAYSFREKRENVTQSMNKCREEEKGVMSGYIAGPKGGGRQPRPIPTENSAI